MSFKPQPPCWGREGVWVTRSAHGCQTLGALPLRRLIIGHLSTLLWSPVELQLRGSDIYFWPLCCLFVSSCVVSCLLRVQWSEMYIWCSSQWFVTGFKETAVDVQMLQPFSAWVYYLALWRLMKQKHFGRVFEAKGEGDRERGRKGPDINLWRFLLVIVAADTELNCIAWKAIQFTSCTAGGWTALFD